MRLTLVSAFSLQLASAHNNSSAPPPHDISSTVVGGYHPDPGSGPFPGAPPRKGSGWLWAFHAAPRPALLRRSSLGPPPCINNLWSSRSSPTGRPGLARPGTETDGAQVEQDPVLTRALVEDENRLKSVLRNSRSFPSKGWPAGRTPFFLES